MELQTFIEKTIKEVTTAIHNSSKDVIDASVGGGASDLYMMNLEFDIAIAASVEKDSTADGGITVINILKAGAESSKSELTRFENRIHFIVPIKLKTIGEKSETGRYSFI